MAEQPRQSTEHSVKIIALLSAVGFAAIYILRNVIGPVETQSEQQRLHELNEDRDPHATLTVPAHPPTPESAEIEETPYAQPAPKP
ncbi:MAG: hypothetical protein UX04_C0002G0101 [Microgenomates group bacterium GW2011_GWF2_45_18]|nr:MAG: hypothetical protein UW18_C0005G0072 [Microgenomates group bacterium GW2011_GWF1_44_10]KKU01958.1 MAG: hypothetical protein UX04_C0002G0101 [Microgenomates group bacterium GW2011_GWF2_45_18]OGJ41028.1 MAG: hypothetical protein A2378_03945 [Candidatus Pacebacteria bacterium RIFOXYB1_FULL_44_10]HAU99057.1 hypothetical protein [Candidatus Paceibacterota bacterium]HAX01228.1 hypothetical protein [Candidatus Paceibacterota bacterium]